MNRDNTPHSEIERETLLMLRVDRLIVRARETLIGSRNDALIVPHLCVEGCGNMTRFNICYICSLKESAKR